MTSFRIAITPSRRAAGRFISQVRRAIQKALAEEEARNGVRQADIARAIGVDRSVIHREIRGHRDLTLGRVAELAWALGRQPSFDLVAPEAGNGSNQPVPPPNCFSTKVQGTQAKTAVKPSRELAEDRKEAVFV